MKESKNSNKLTSIFKQYQGLWIALNEKEEVIANAEYAKEVLEESRKKGYPNPVIFRVPTELISYVGLSDGTKI